MKWTEPKVGDTRVVEKFLYTPTTINGETRWWEKAKVKQEYVKDTSTSVSGPLSQLVSMFGWSDKEWVD